MRVFGSPFQLSDVLLSLRSNRLPPLSQIAVRIDPTCVFFIFANFQSLLAFSWARVSIFPIHELETCDWIGFNSHLHARSSSENCDSGIIRLFISWISLSELIFFPFLQLRTGDVQFRSSHLNFWIFVAFRCSIITIFSGLSSFRHYAWAISFWFHFQSPFPILENFQLRAKGRVFWFWSISQLQSWDFFICSIFPWFRYAKFKFSVYKLQSLQVRVSIFIKHAVVNVGVTTLPYVDFVPIYEVNYVWLRVQSWFMVWILVCFCIK